MRLPIPLKLLVLTTACIAIAVSSQSCRKKEIQALQDSAEIQIPKALYGTWHMLYSTYQYFEFVEAEGDSFYNLLEQNMRVMQKSYCRITADSIHFEALHYAYNLKGNDLHLYGSRGTLDFKRADANTVNHNNWQRPVQIINEISLPRGFDPAGNAGGFAVHGDTIYYWHASGAQMMCYNTANNAYPDSFAYHKPVQQCLVNPPYWYYIIGDPQNPALDSVKRSTGFNKRFENSGFTDNRQGTFSIDRKTDLFYRHNYGKMYAGEAGGPLHELQGFYADYLHTVMHYRDNEFIIKGALANTQNLGIMSFSGNITSRPVSYKAIPGYDHIASVATDGENIWVCAMNNETGRYALLNIRLN